MRKDPNEDIRWLEKELLAVEAEEEEDYEEAFDEDYGEYEEEEDWLADAKALIGEHRHNPAVDWGRTVYDEEEEEFDEDAAVLYESPRQRKKRLKKEKAQQQKEQKQAQKERKSKGIGGLLLLAVLEVLGILTVLGWWIEWLT